MNLQSNSPRMLCANALGTERQKVSRSFLFGCQLVGCLYFIDMGDKLSILDLVTYVWQLFFPMGI